MKLPIGMLIYWAHRHQEDHAVISGMWYYQEIYVPSTIEQKKNSVSDLKRKRCTLINIHGKFDQIADVISRGNSFIEAGSDEIEQFNQLIKDIENAPSNKAYLFDDINDIKGTALMVDTIIEVDESMEEIQEYLRKGKPVDVNISEDWSFAGDLLNALNVL